MMEDYGSERKEAEKVGNAETKHETAGKPKEDKEMEKIVFPPDFDFSLIEFSSRIIIEDQMPIMPRMALVEARLNSFLKKFADHPEKQIYLLAAMGLYYVGVDTHITDIDDFDAFDAVIARFVQYKKDKKNNPELVYHENKPEPTDGICLCFCCGERSYFPLKYPIKNKQRIRHHLNCKFFKLPSDKEYIKSSIIPYRGIHDIDLDHMNKCRKAVLKDDYKPATIADFQTKIPKCKNCKENEAAIRYIKCNHKGYCASCAKSSENCLECGVSYTGLEKEFYE